VNVLKFIIRTMSRTNVTLLGVMLVALLAAWIGSDNAPPPELMQPRYAFWNLFIQIGIAIVASIISAALAPKPKAPEPVKARVPVVEEGRKIGKVYGTVWVDDSMVLAFKPVGTIKIKSKGKK